MKLSLFIVNILYPAFDYGTCIVPGKNTHVHQSQDTTIKTEGVTIQSSHQHPFYHTFIH